MSESVVVVGETEGKYYFIKLLPHYFDHVNVPTVPHLPFCLTVVCTAAIP